MAKKNKITPFPCDPQRVKEEIARIMNRFEQQVTKMQDVSAVSDELMLTEWDLSFFHLLHIKA